MPHWMYGPVNRRSAPTCCNRSLSPHLMLEATAWTANTTEPTWFTALFANGQALNRKICLQEVLRQPMIGNWS